MNISIIGSGYVGLCTGVGFALANNNVICVDIDKAKVDAINSGRPPIEETGLAESLKKVKSKLTATADMAKAVNDSSITFICVGTPAASDGSIDLKYVRSAAEEIGLTLKNKKDFHLIVVKSTVVPGTTETTVIPALEKMSGKKAGKDFGVCMNPEFLKEGSALDDFLRPDRVVIGSINEKSGKLLEELYKGFGAPLLRTDLKTAEMIKYASNVFLATKISMANELGNICKKLGIDSYEVARAIGHDKRIGNLFLNSGVGFGGSCFSKDIKAISHQAKTLGYEAKMINQVLSTNKEQRLKIIELLEKRMNLKNKTIAILGLAFKANTDDIRDSPAVEIVAELKKKGCKINAYDPQAAKNFRAVHRDITYANTATKALQNADACLILTEWDEFKKLSDKDFSVMKNKIIIEGRRVLKREQVKDYEGVCW